MEYIIRAREAISKNKIVLVYFFITLIIAGFQSDLITGGIVLLFSVMILEDFRQQTVDMRAFLVLLLLMVCTAVNFLYFCVHFLVGFLLFRLLYLLTTKIKAPINDKEMSIKTNSIKIERLSFGYLPVFGLSWVIYTLFFSNTGPPAILVPAYEGVILLKAFFIHNILAAGIAGTFLFLLWGIREYCLHKAEKEKREIIYGFGDGDVFVLGAFCAYLGFEVLMVIFLLSLFIQAGWYLIYFFRGDFNDRV
ncbi:MAG: hypothetical protein H6Q70_97 [Firmicutes bacterium]|nr:hypothetical protein [Bacillota bacterium]